MIYKAVPGPKTVVIKGDNLQSACDYFADIINNSYFVHPCPCSYSIYGLLFRPFSYRAYLPAYRQGKGNEQAS